MSSSSKHVWSIAEQDEAFPRLWSQARTLWDAFEKSLGFDAYVPADYPSVLESLRKLQGRATTFLEWGSGLGVVTIMASRLGFESYGMEVSEELINHSRELALEYAPRATFACGSFVPEEYRWNPKLDDDGCRTDFDAGDGYGELDMRLDDFDIVYAYPWPHEHRIFCDILRKHGRPGMLFLSYDVHEGMQLKRIRGA